MPTEEELQAGFRMGDWLVLPARGVLRCGDREVRPEPLTLNVLLSLARRDGDLVTRDELIADAWGGRATADDPINRAIALLRKTLDDKQKPPEYVETLHRRGYRLMKPVELLQQAQGDTREPTKKPGSRKWKLIAAMLAAGVIALTAYIWFPMPTPVRSVAVMPFDNLSGRSSDEYLVSGFKEELVQTLHNIDNFTVKNGRVRYDKEHDAIAELLDVESVISGSLRRNGDQLRISYTISRRGKGVVFAGDIDGTVGELFALQEALAVMARNNLLGKSTQTLIKSRPSDSAAYDSYMRGIFALEHRGAPGNLELSIDLFKNSIALDSHYGPSYLSLATAYALMVDYRNAPLDELNRLALETVDAGIRVDPGIADAAGAIYGIVHHKQKRWLASEQAYLRAVNADVVDSNAFNWYSRMLASVGRLDEALLQVLRAVEIDPGSAVINSRVAISYTWLGDTENTQKYFQRSIDLGASGTSQFLAYALFLARDGQLEKSLQITTAGMVTVGANSEWVAPLFKALADTNDRPQALAALDAAANSDQLPLQVDVTARTMLGDIDGAMRVAELLDGPGEIFEMDLLFIPEMQPLRQHPDFMPLLQRLGIVDYWAAIGCEWLDDKLICDN